VRRRRRRLWADGSLDAVSILCLLSIRGKMLENSDSMSNIPRTCKELQTHRRFECPKPNGLNLVSRMSPTNCLHRSVLVPCLGYCKWRLLTSPATYRAPPSSRSVHYRNGPQPSSKGQATIGQHAGGKCSHNLGICFRATPWNQKLSSAINSPHAKTCTKIDNPLGLRCSSSSVHLSGKRDDMAMIQRAVALPLSNSSRIPLYMRPR